jgi:hypothetical protein
MDMKHELIRIVAGLVLLGTLAACFDGTTAPVLDEDLAAAFVSVPLGFDNAVSTFDPGTTGGRSAFDPEGQRGRFGPARSSLMGGGLGGLFLGEGFADGFGTARNGDPMLNGDCGFDASTGRIECPTNTVRGLSIDRSAAFADAGGGVQSGFDRATTNSINTIVQVHGTVTLRNGVTTNVSHASERTVSGLADGSTVRTVNGASAGEETTTARGFTVVRVAGDTTSNVVIPITPGLLRAYPSSGTVTRSMKVTLTRDGAARTETRREVVTFDGSDTAKVVITEDGRTITCALPLRSGRPSCSVSG